MLGDRLGKKRQVGRHSLESLLQKPDDVVMRFSVATYRLRREGLLQVLVGASTNWGARSASHAVERLHHISQVFALRPLLGDAHCKAVLGDSPDLPAVPALALQLGAARATGRRAPLTADV